MADEDDEQDLINEKLDQMNPQRFTRDNFLDAIQQIESSGGQNTNHPMIQHGPEAGQQAIGNYGLLPNTINELNNRARMTHQLTPEMQAVSRAPASLNDNADLEKQYANQLADRVLNREQDPYMAAYAWNSGHNLTPQQIQDRGYMNDPYVQKFSKIWKAMGNK